MRFHLVRYFTLTSLVIFVLVAAGLAYVQRQIAIDNMLTAQEHNNVNMTRIFANVLWDDFDGFVKNARNLTLDELKNAPEQQVLYGKVEALLRNLSVLKVKVYNLDALTVFSTEASQIGDTKYKSGGYLAAKAGKNATELSFRPKFNAFGKTVTNRDVISSYIPILDPDTQQQVAVFEIYTDITPAMAAINQTGYVVLGVVVAGLALLFIALFFIVKRADNIIQRQAEDKERTQLQLAQNEKMASLGQMVAGVAHELNTPLAFTRSNISMIRDFVEELKLPMEFGHKLIRQVQGSDGNEFGMRVRVGKLLRERVADVQDDLTPEQLDEMLEQTLTGLEQMNELVVNLKEFTRLDRAKVSEFDINKGISNVIYISRSAIPEAVEINTDLAELPKVQCNPSQVNQIFINLIVNAAQAMNGAGKVDVRTEMVGDQVKIEVEDNGPGMSKEQQAHIFEAFYTTKQDSGGTGLGLSITHDIVEQHGGQIFVESEVGKGSKFTVLLPVKGVMADSEAA